MGLIRCYGVNMKKKNIKFLYYFVLIFLIILVLALGVIFAIRYKNSNKNTVNESEVSISTASKKEVKNPIDFEKLKQQNSDIYAWIKIPNTNINYPVLQSFDQDDNYYLTHDENKKYSFGGSIYTQRLNSTDFSDRNTVIYGHDLLTGDMFTQLHKFKDETFFNKNKYIYIYTENHILKYKIISAYKYDDRHILNSFDFSNDEVYSEYLEYIQNPKSVLKNVRKGIKLGIEDRIITLSTCIGNESDKRYLVQGVLVKDVETK